MDELRRMLASVKSPGVVPTTSFDDEDCRCFVSKLLHLLVQPCGKLDLVKKCSLVSEYMPKEISADFLEEASKCLADTGYDHKPMYYEDMPMIALDEMQKSSSTLEDFCRSYFMFHGMDINNHQTLFQYLPILSFTDSIVYQLDALNEETLQTPNSEITIFERGTEKKQMLTDSSAYKFKRDAFRPLIRLYESKGVLTKRIENELKSGEEYWALERKLCSSLMNNEEISIQEVIKAVHFKGFDYRVMNLLLYQLRGEEVDEMLMDFLSTSEFLVEVYDDLSDYEKDVKENTFNILRFFIGAFGSSASIELEKCIAEVEQKHNNLLKLLDPELSAKYLKRCIEAAREGGDMSADSEHAFGIWRIPTLILDEESYRSNLKNPKKQP